MYSNSYALITPARNEEAYIEKTIKSVISQTIFPKKWVVVSDGSTDRTNDIVQKYQNGYDFIQLLQLEGCKQRSFASRVYAIRSGIKCLTNVDYDFLGILDGDITFEDSYYESILEEFGKDPKLGIAGGLVFDQLNGKLNKTRNRTLNHVAGGVQLFRIGCYEVIKGYRPLKWGGVDTVAETTARMHGWRVKSFPDIKVIHHRQTGCGDGIVWQARYLEGLRDYSIGYHPLYYFAKCFRRVLEMPYFLGSVLRLTGYFWAGFRGYERDVSVDFVNFLRDEQLNKIRSLLYLHKRKSE